MGTILVVRVRLMWYLDQSVYRNNTLLVIILLEYDNRILAIFVQQVFSVDAGETKDVPAMGCSEPSRALSIFFGLVFSKVFFLLFLWL